METAFMICCGALGFVVLLIGLIFLTMLVEIIFDVDIPTFWPLDTAHFVLVFPVMLMFMCLRFKMQHRNEMIFYFFEFSDIEANIVRKMGYDFECDDEEYSVQNVFGAKWERIDTTTTVFRRK